MKWLNGTWHIARCSRQWRRFYRACDPAQLQNSGLESPGAIEAAAVWWMYRRLPHPGLKYFGLLLYCGAIFRLIPSAAFLQYHERGWPVVNWLLYSYGVPCICFSSVRQVLPQSKTQIPSPISRTRYRF